MTTNAPCHAEAPAIPDSCRTVPLSFRRHRPVRLFFRWFAIRCPQPFLMRGSTSTGLESHPDELETEEYDRYSCTPPIHWIPFCRRNIPGRDFRIGRQPFRPFSRYVGHRPVARTIRDRQSRPVRQPPPSHHLPERNGPHLRIYSNNALKGEVCHPRHVIKKPPVELQAAFQSCAGGYFP